MTGFVFIIIILVLLWAIIRIYNYSRKGDNYNKNTGDYNKTVKDEKKADKTKETSFPKEKKSFSGFFKFTAPSPYENESISWCANFLNVDKKELRTLLNNIPSYYTRFKIRKRSGGFRIISAPQQRLLSIQQTIYRRVLLPVNLHPAATGFRQGVSIVNNAGVHLGKKNILKTDIQDFFGSIHLFTAENAFERIGYPQNIAQIFAQLCCLNKRLPQGAPTSPALSNIIAYEMDKNLAGLSEKHGLNYSRYADDLTFSGDSLSRELILPAIVNIAKKEGFFLNRKKTCFIAVNRRKIITGVSISSGNKLTVPKAKKRELRKIIYFIRTKGLAEHQRFIGSSDPAYLKRVLGYLNFWKSIEPENQYVKDSIKALKAFSR